ncbi:MAG TPA: YciI family protein [Caulobacteraceae bacterium]
MRRDNPRGAAAQQKEHPMRYMMIVKGTAKSEAGVMPTEDQFAEMGAYNEELAKAGVLVDLAGLQATSKGAKIRFSGGKRTLIHGPFPDATDIFAGYWIINVKSPEEAVEWAMKAPNPSFGDADGEIELRRFFEMEDFEPSPALDKARELEFPGKR